MAILIMNGKSANGIVADVRKNSNIPLQKIFCCVLNDDPIPAPSGTTPVKISDMTIGIMPIGIEHTIDYIVCNGGITKQFWASLVYVADHIGQYGRLHKYAKTYECKLITIEKGGDAVVIGSIYGHGVDGIITYHQEQEYIPAKELVVCSRGHTYDIAGTASPNCPCCNQPFVGSTG